jgi:hypothetical protein
MHGADLRTRRETPQRRLINQQVAERERQRNGIDSPQGGKP